MSSDWKVLQASQVCGKHKSAMSTGPFGSAISSRYFVDSGVPVIRGGNLSQDVGTRLNHEDLVFITEDKAREFERSTVKHGDLVFTCWGTIDQVGLIDERSHYEEYVISNKQMKMTPDPAITDSRFLYYQFSSPKIKSWIIDNGIGSSVPGFNLGMLKSIELNIPSLPEQKAIAHILGTLDDKIELNRKTTETLEAMAKALFKSWFVDFDPVRAKAEGRPTGLPAEISDLFPDSFEDSELGEIPSGWSVAEIDQILNLQKDSLDPSSAPDETFDHYSIPAFDAGKHPARELGSSILSQKFLVGDEDLLVSKLNPSTPRVWIPFASSGRRGICSTEFLVCRTSSIFGRAYAYCLASSDAIVEAMIGLAGGTSNSHQRIRPGDFLALPCCIGTEMVRSAFLDVVEPLLSKSLALRNESRSLSTTRDSLLPKLISGEIRIPDAEKMLEEVGI